MGKGRIYDFASDNSIYHSVDSGVTCNINQRHQLTVTTQSFVLETPPPPPPPPLHEFDVAMAGGCIPLG